MFMPSKRVRRIHKNIRHVKRKIARCSSYHPKWREYKGAWDALREAHGAGRFHLLAIPYGEGEYGLWVRSAKRGLHPSDREYEVELDEWKSLVDKTAFTDMTGRVVVQPMLRLWVCKQPTKDGQDREAFGLSYAPEIRNIRGYPTVVP
jgi:hypothetical protein